ncbi:site-specific DNA-methyltransferase [Roseicitreum antarcticum]|uniref:site-specific DNA-methyltransferase (adenine-specific) n=1 Tax=Roseicitreum antarcticum TaxID=564137 RepID=A0A1H3G2U1_9RHOB|nr:site-specific DNA-methyltransferase [Roseicitreum antarcticum]SDX97405.1 adenine-specific DNA-methyltransferase [Roseicitreum antarcticum]
MPPGDAEVVLSYPNKAERSDIIKSTPRQFLIMNGESAKNISSIPENSFILDDNFFVLNELIREGTKVNLYYLDPPYGTGFDFHSRDLEHAYKDSMGPAAYIEFMRRRLILMRETMADDGSIYVHIGHQMLGHLKVVMDEVFGSDNFRNLITRRKCSSKNFTSKQYANINDYILFYSKTKSYKWNKPGIDPEQDWIEREYPKFDNIGRRYKLVPVHAPGTRNGETGKQWRGMMPPPGKHWQYVPDKLEELDRQGDIHWSRNGNPRRKVYWSSDKKTALTDYWDQYRDAHHQSIKITGYPTEKNLAMVKMIVGASSDEGDLVVDPFCGSGTTLHAARDLKRRYLGIDASFSAAKATIRRMRHGLERMGDYVNKHEKKAESPPLPSANRQEEQACGFVVDSQLFDAYPQEIQDISEV